MNIRYRIIAVLAVAALLALFAALGAAQADPGDLDPTWGDGGLTTTDFSGAFDQNNVIALQADGKLAMAGWANAYPGDFGMVRYGRDGRLDATFGEGGLVTTAFSSDPALVDAAWQLNIRPDGRYLVGGETCDADYIICDLAIAAYTVDGKPDPSFAQDGRVTTDPGEVLDRPDILTAYAWPRRSVLQDDGKLVIVGIVVKADTDVDIVLVRYNTNGSLDQTFGTKGVVLLDVDNTGNYPQDVMGLEDGKILVVGALGEADPGNPFRYSPGPALMAQFNADGSLDNSFGGGDGIVTWLLDGEPYLAQSPLVLDGESTMAAADRLLYVMGNVGSATEDGHCVLQRFSLDGTLDTTYGIDGAVIIDSGAYDFCWDMRATADGKLVFAGGADVEVPDGTTRQGVGRGPLLPGVSRSAVRAEVTATLVGRYNVDGTPDNSFGEDGLLVHLVNENGGGGYGLAAQPDGKIIVNVTVFQNDTDDFGAVRFLGDGPAAQVYAPVVRGE